MKLLHFFAYLLGSLAFIQIHAEKFFVIVVPSYNNEQWVERNLTSILTQDYLSFHVVYIDDCSSDTTFERVTETIKRHNAQDKVTLISNSTRRGAMANFYNAIHACPDEVIIVNVDGDDWLADSNVLKYLNRVYADSDVWMTFGQFLFDRHNTIGFCKPFSDDIIRANRFRQSPGKLPISHLRTYYAWIFKQIKLKDVLYEGDFYPMTCDKAIMAPIIEMCGRRHKCIEKVLYIYNEFNPINDHQVDKSLQHFLCDYILARAPYQPLKIPINIEKKCVGKTVSRITKSSPRCQLHVTIDNCTSDYLLVSTEPTNISDQDAQRAIHYLEKTGAKVAYFNAANDLRASGSTYVELSFGALAWQPVHASENFRYPLSGSTFLTRRCDLKELLFDDLCANIDEISFLDDEDVCITIG